MDVAFPATVGVIGFVLPELSVYPQPNSASLWLTITKLVLEEVDQLTKAFNSEVAMVVG